MTTITLNMAPDDKEPLFGGDAASWVTNPASLARAYWAEEVRLGCEVALERLRAICAARGWGFNQTVEALTQGAEHGR